MTAHILVTAAPRQAGNVALCAGDKGVTRADRTKGPYDVVCVVEGENGEALHQVVLNSIQGIAGVTRLYTCFVEEAY
jgi:DNA-binding Lrp family transcriptional regulator